jgi:prevent-host-death family protein
LDPALRPGSGVIQKPLHAAVAGNVDHVVNITNSGRIMDLPVSAAEANRSFSQILRGVRTGQTYVVTAHGKPVARIVPCDEASAARAAARVTLLQRLAAQPVTNIGPWRHDELYER